jgi:nitrite reductase (NADH) large subunit
MEPFLPYWRPRLPEVIHTGAPAESIFIDSAEKLEAQGIQFLASKKAAAIDPAKKTVSWEDGSATEYDALVLACGSFPNMPPVPFTDAVYPLRTYEDAVRIRQESRRAGKAFVVGGGILGLEAAFAVSQLGVPVKVYDISDYPLPRQLDREGGMFLKKRLAKEGITVLSGAALETFKPDIEGACVIAAAGVKPATELASRCGIKTNRGILVDEYMRTSEPDIYACGDSAEFSGAVPGLIAIASAQGDAAGANAAGIETVYHPVIPAPNMEVAGISFASYGSVQAAAGTDVYRRTTGNDYAIGVVTAGKLTGIALIGNTAAGIKFKKWMEKGEDIGPVSSFDDIERRILGSR